MLNSMEIASLYAKIGADTSSFDRALRNSDKQMQSFGGRVGMATKRVAGGMALMGAAGMAALGAMGAIVTKAGFAFNDLSQQGTIAFETMLGSADKAKAFLSELQQFAAETPFEYASLMEASQKMLAMGFKKNDVLPTLTAIGDAVAALGGGQEKIDRVTVALGQMQAKGKASAEEMMQLTEAGIPAWEMLAEKIGVDIPTAMKMVTKGEITAQQSIEAVVEGMNKRFGGMMEKQSRTFSGLKSTISDVFQVTAGKVIKPLFDAVVNGMSWIVDFTNRPAFARGVETLARWVGVLTEKTIQTAQAFADRFGPALRSVGRFALALPNAWRKFREIVDNVNDPGLARTLNRLRNGFAGLGKVLKSLAAPFKNAFDGLFKSLMVARGGGWSAIFDVLTTRMMKAVSDFGQVLSNEAIPFVLSKLKELGTAIKGWVGEVNWWEKVKGWAAAFAEWANKVWEWTRPYLAAMWNSLTSWVTDPAKRQRLWDAVRSGWNAVVRWAKAIWGWTVPHLTGLWDSISSWAGNPEKRRELWDKVRNGWSAITDWAKATWRWAKPHLVATWSSLTSWITDPAKRKALFTKAKNTWVGFTEWAGKVWDWAEPKLATMWNTLSSWVTDPDKRAKLRSRVSMAWTGFSIWAGETWGKIEPKLTDMYGKLTAWIDENHPQLGGWIDKFETFLSDLKTQWDESFPAMGESFKTLRETLEREGPLMAEAISRLWRALFEGGDGVDGGGLVKSLETVFDAITRTIGTVATQTRILIDMMAVIAEGSTALRNGDFGRVGQLAAELRDLMAEFGAVTGAQWDWFRTGLAARLLEERAYGGRATFGGMTLVGERGPELVNLPAGSHVYTAGQTAGMMGGGRLDLYVHGESSLPIDRRKIRELALMLQREVQLAGGRVLAV